MRHESIASASHVNRRANRAIADLGIAHLSIKDLELALASTESSIRQHMSANRLELIASLSLVELSSALEQELYARYALQFSVRDGVMFGNDRCQHLGSERVIGTTTGALRQFNLPTARAPGDWPAKSEHTVRY